ncbi:hypothetical protein JXA85_01450 [Candidatus Woesearchaeota archaeon]|nr:hypothetical protein [Candidatus Woesearchaeota archaeon]
MSDAVVTIRMPKGLSKELKRLAKDAHFMDMSEEIRSIVRQKFLSWKEGFDYEKNE